MSLERITQNCQSIRRTLDALSPKGKACQLLCVTKYASIDNIQHLYSAGERLFGENKVQDTQKKIDQLNLPSISWHFIGHLQRNKVKKAIQLYDCIQSVDSLRLLKKINEESEKLNKKQDIFIQINVSEDPKKYGFTVPDFTTSLSHFLSFNSCVIKGIMIMGPQTSDSAQLTAVFKQGVRLKKMAESITTHKLMVSMGMSNDFEIALKEGSDMIRIGRMLFD